MPYLILKRRLGQKLSLTLNGVRVEVWIKATMPNAAWVSIDAPAEVKVLGTELEQDRETGQTERNLERMKDAAKRKKGVP